MVTIHYKITYVDVRLWKTVDVLFAGCEILNYSYIKVHRRWNKIIQLSCIKI